MERKPLEYYLKLKYPTMVQRIGREYEAWHPDFGRGTMFVRARSVQRAMRELSAFRRDTIRAYYERGITVPEPVDMDKQEFSGQFVLRIPKELHARLARDARSNNVSMNAYITYLLALNKGAMVDRSLVGEAKKRIQSAFGQSPVDNPLNWSKTVYSIVRHVVVHINQREIEFPREGLTSQQVNNIPITVENAVANAA